MVVHACFSLLLCLLKELIVLEYWPDDRMLVHELHGLLYRAAVFKKLPDSSASKATTAPSDLSGPLDLTGLVLSSQTYKA